MMLGVYGAAAQESTLALNAHTGDILYAYEEDLPFPPASLTKMMTLYMAFEALGDSRLAADQELSVSAMAAKQPASRLGLKQGTTIKTKDAILALITKSANDAAVVLAEAMAGTETDFARLMTSQARRLGMANTVFRNASGLHEPGQLTTARDMGKLAMALLGNHPYYYKQFATDSFTWNGRRYTNHNPLLSKYEGADGIKTGYVRQSGYNLVGSAERAGLRVIAVVLGSKTPSIRDWAMTTLLDYGFERVEEGAAWRSNSSLPFIANPGGEQAVRVAIREVARPASLGRPVGKAANAPVGFGAMGIAPTLPGNWAVQVGAYPTTPPAEEAVLKAKALVPDLLGDARVSFPVVTRSGSRFYRARLVGLTEAEARSACRKLASRAIPCLAIGDDGDFKTSLVQ
jgi:D-alanyl-D-alanine carboxypeptidase